MGARVRLPSRFLAFLLVFLACGLIGFPGTVFGSRVPGGNPASLSPAPTIGALLPLTGGLSFFGTDMAKAIQLLDEQVNGSGGIRGSNLTVHVVDSQTDPVAARNGATTLIQQKGVQAIVGGVSSSEALAAAPVTEAAGVVLISPTATVAAISTSDSNDSLWRTTASDRLQGKAAALLSYNNLSYRRIGILAANNAYGNALATSFLENFTVLGGTIPILVYYTPNNADYSSDLTILFSSNPEAVYLVAYPYEGTIILNNWWSNHAAWPTHWILTDGMEDQVTMDQLRSGGVNTTGFIGLTPTRSSTATGMDAYERFRSAFAARFGSNPVILSENAYDSAFVLALAMHASGSTDPSVFRTAIRYVANPPGLTILPGQWAQAVAALDAGQDIDYWGAANRVDFDGYGDTGTAYSVWQVNATGTIGNVAVLDEPLFWTPAPEGSLPIAVHVQSPTSGSFLSGPVTISGTASAANGLVAVQVRVDAGTWANATGTSNWTFPLDTTGLADGPHQIGARSFDGTNYSAEVTVAVTVDNTPPSLRIDRPQAGSFVAPSFSSAWTAWDPRSGIEHLRIQLDTDPPVVLPGSAISLNFADVAEGVHTLSIRAFDGAGNARQALVAFTVDSTPPTTTLTVFGNQGQAGWFTSGVTLLLAPTDPLSGVDTTFVRVGTNPFASYTAPIAIRNDGVYTVGYYTKDLVGNVEPVHTLQISIDTTPPTVEISPHPSFLRQADVIISWTGADATSGIVRYEVNLDDEPYRSVGLATSEPFLLSNGEHRIHVRAVDAAGLQTNRSAHVTVDTNVFSFTGPYGGAPTIAIPVAIAVVAFVLFWRRRRGGGKEPATQTGEGPPN